MEGGKGRKKGWREGGRDGGREGGSEREGGDREKDGGKEGKEARDGGGGKGLNEERGPPPPLTPLHPHSPW